MADVRKQKNRSTSPRNFGQTSEGARGVRNAKRYPGGKVIDLRGTTSWRGSPPLPEASAEFFGWLTDRLGLRGADNAGGVGGVSAIAVMPGMPGSSLRTRNSWVACWRTSVRDWSLGIPHILSAFIAASGSVIVVLRKSTASGLSADDCRRVDV
jgi:hypothetical protein